MGHDDSEDRGKKAIFWWRILEELLANSDW